VKKISWTDYTALETIKQLRDEFKVETFIETGTFKGINSFVQAGNFKYVLTCEKNREFVSEAMRLLKGKENALVFNNNSPEFLRDFVKRYRENKLKDTVIIYLDAHFYDPEAKNKFIITEELEALKGFRDCIIIIHDFNNGLGHIEYDGQSLTLDFLKKRIMHINPLFRFYTNTKEFSDIHTIESLHETGLNGNQEAEDNIRYAWSSKRLTKRGILYCVPKELDLNRYKLIKWN
jgi:hypothetical protein